MARGQRRVKVSLHDAAVGAEPPCPPPGGGSNARPRDYYRIEDEDGHRYWVFREGLYQESGLGSPGWFLHGVFG